MSEIDFVETNFRKTSKITLQIFKKKFAIAGFSSLKFRLMPLAQNPAEKGVDASRSGDMSQP